MKVIFDCYTIIIAKDFEEFKQIFNFVNRHLKYKNPKFEESDTFNSNIKFEEYYELYEIDYEKYIFKLPKNIKKMLIEMLNYGLKIESFENNRINKNENIKFKANFEPRDEQQKISIDNFFNLPEKHGTLGGLCGFGKSFSSLKILEKINKKTLIIVDQILILEQWIGYFEEWSNYKKEDISIIQGNNLSFDKNIIIATVQTLEKNLDLCDKFKDSISVIVVDECHCAAANTFQTILYHFKPYYLLGLSATLERDDDLTFLIKHSIGESYFVADREKLVKDGLIMKPDFKPILMKRKNFYADMETKKMRNVNAAYRTIISAFKKDNMVVKFACELAYHHQKKGDKILMIIKEEIYARKYYELLLERFIFTKEQIDIFKKKADEVNAKKIEKNKEKEISKIEKEFFQKTTKIKQKYHLGSADPMKLLDNTEISRMKKKIKQKMEDDEEDLNVTKWFDLEEVEKSSRVAIIMGKTKPERRKEIIEKAKNGEIDIVITTKILDKAVSINNLNVLLNLFPNREFANNVQRIGRISRTHKNKTYAIVYDFVYYHPIFFSQFYNRRKKNRMMAYEETCVLPNFISEFVNYCQRLFYSLEDKIQDYPELLKNKNFAIVDLDKMEDELKCK